MSLTPPTGMTSQNLVGLSSVGGPWGPHARPPDLTGLGAPEEASGAADLDLTCKAEARLGASAP